MGKWRKFPTKKGLMTSGEIYKDPDFKKIIKVGRTTFQERIRKGMDFEKALITEPMPPEQIPFLMWRYQKKHKEHFVFFKK